MISSTSAPNSEGKSTYSSEHDRLCPKGTHSLLDETNKEADFWPSQGRTVRELGLWEHPQWTLTQARGWRSFQEEELPWKGPGIRN